MTNSSGVWQRWGRQDKSWDKGSGGHPRAANIASVMQHVCVTSNVTFTWCSHPCVIFRYAGLTVMAPTSYRLPPSQHKRLATGKCYHLSEFQKKMLGDNTINRACKIWSNHSLWAFKTKSTIIMKLFFFLNNAKMEVLCMRWIYWLVITTYQLLCMKHRPQNKKQIAEIISTLFFISSSAAPACKFLLSKQQQDCLWPLSGVSVRSSRWTHCRGVWWEGRPAILSMSIRKSKAFRSYVRGSRLAWLTAIRC